MLISILIGGLIWSVIFGLIGLGIRLIRPEGTRWEVPNVLITTTVIAFVLTAAAYASTYGA